MPNAESNNYIQCGPLHMQLYKLQHVFYRAMIYIIEEYLQEHAMRSMLEK